MAKANKGAQRRERKSVRDAKRGQSDAIDADVQRAIRSAQRAGAQIVQESVIRTVLHMRKDKP